MSGCPSTNRLTALMREELSDREAAEIEDHLDRCSRCRARLHELPDWALSEPVCPAGSVEVVLPSSIQRLAARQPASILSGPRGSPYPVCPQPLPIPDRIPEFDQIRKVGQGGMGTVYRAVQDGLDRAVALKVLHEASSADGYGLRRFRREVQALARIRHPNVVQIHDIGAFEGRPFLVMEWIEGGDLGARLREGPLAVTEAIKILVPLARALQAAHDLGIVHRDLKPGNVLLAVDEAGGHRPQPKLVDFGLARLVGEAPGQTTRGTALGTPGFMAPEQTGLMGDVPQGPAVDIYAMGALLYTMLIGRPPFAGSTAAEVLHQVVADDPVPPRRLRSSIPRDLETICLKCLERDPSRRYATATEVAEELERFQAGHPIRARRAGPWERAVRRCRRRPFEAGLALALVATVALAFGAVTWLWRQANAETVLARRAAEAESRLRREIQASAATGELDRGIELALAGEPDRGTVAMAAAIRLVPDTTSPVARVARAGLSAWADALVPLVAVLDHDGVIGQAVFRDDGAAILTGSFDGTARLWDAVSGRPLSTTIHHGDQIYSLAISPDGRRMATGGGVGIAHLWDADGRPIGRPMTHAKTVWDVAFSPDGRTLTTLG